MGIVYTTCRGLPFGLSYLLTRSMMMAQLCPVVGTKRCSAGGHGATGSMHHYFHFWPTSTG